MGGCVRTKEKEKTKKEMGRVGGEMDARVVQAERNMVGGRVG